MAEPEQQQNRLETDQEWARSIALPDKITTEDDFVRLEREHRIIHELAIENLLSALLLMMATTSETSLPLETSGWGQYLENHNTLVRRRRRLTRLLREYLQPSGPEQDDQPGD